MSLTPAQLAFRKNFIGGSAANIIMNGDKKKILQLWHEYRGEMEPEDLSDVLPVAIGTATEAVNIEFFERRTGRKVTCQGAERLSLFCSWAACTLDGLTDDEQTVFEAKTVSAFSNSEEIVRRYYPQLTHNMLVCGLRKSVLSVIYGNGHKFEQYEIALDQAYADELFNAEEHFWQCVLYGEKPVVIDPPAIPVEPIRIADMSESNEWGSAAADWIANLSASKTFDKATKMIKSLVPADAIEAFGNGISAKRNKAGSVTIKTEEKK
jgi:predicted phage-related endonuclease